MQKIEASIVIQKGVDAVWEKLARLETWQGFAQSWGGSSSGYRLTAPSPLSANAEITVANARGKQLGRARVSRFDRPRSVELVVNEQQGGAKSFFMSWQVSLESLYADTTKATFSLVLIYPNILFEVLSMIPPTPWFFRRALRKGLEHLKK